MARVEPEEEREHAGSRLVSYCDMISLLVTFFLMMMTFSTHSDHDVREVGLGLLDGRGGIWKSPVCLPEEHAVEPKVARALARELAELSIDAEGRQRAALRSVGDGIAVGFDLRSSFAPGSAEPSEALRENLERLARALERYDHLVIVEGFDDDAFAGNELFPSSEELSLARAANAARVLSQSGIVAPELLQIAAHGAARPRATNATEAGRASNRRIEVRIAALDLPRIARHALENREEG